ncbi:bifunctional (p)ppGpp synthetase/guanosine-3',5'-bis(diphosphate) 3'-pyrophosphohydrolase [Saccharophagus sp. K07]|nr:bifunctional (p)ppGpp synthetase/guanosine-3',5'-bis(diphosphate) 3'-pyrophosphohydrolase [Saccharophagus sp. K07]
MPAPPFASRLGEKVQNARAFAMRAHGSQKYGDMPYVFHLDQVVELLQDYGEVAQVIGYLHDSVEDTSINIADIENEFGAFVAHCVSLVTDPPGPDRASRKTKTYARLATVKGEAEMALIVKAADRLANVRMCVKENNKKLLEVYRKEQPVFFQSAYRQGLCDEFWQELQQLLQ